ncbi:hypothetical protein DFP72DRAFT_1080960 [Ephemerocybe angulata]|uniref:F-box domain-containing protein n=1 Tax=Ephemerocybe angulata TaxID=980116 RepID=A0A8H6HAN1_9AGAR|nr:hypothetical protein DFP72DRAFT_1080960 [Tulosesus angulatus]
MSYTALSSVAPDLSPSNLVSASDFEFMLGSTNHLSHVQSSTVMVMLASVNRRIEQFEERVAKLDIHRRLLQSMLSSLRKFPVEILGEIFLLVVPAILGPLDRKMVGNLGRVCKRWRDALLGTPAVWRGLVIRPCRCWDRLPDVIARRHNADYRKIVTWFERAGGHPKVLVYGSDGTTCRCELGGVCRSVHPIVTRLFREGPPLDHFTLQVSTTTCFKNWVAQVGATEGGLAENPRWTALPSFSLEFEDDIHQPWDYNTETDGSVFNLLPPAVRRLGVHLPSFSDEVDHSISTSGLPINLPIAVLSGLISLGIRWDWGGNRLVEVLSNCPVLEHLSLDLSYSDPFDIDSFSRPLVLVSLKSFHLCMGGLKVLDLFEMPSLTSLDLELNVDRHGSTEVSDRLTRFIKASRLQRTLVFLRVCELVGSPCTIVLILPPLHALEHLVLDSSTACGYHFGPNVMPPVRVFPSLRHLELLNLKPSKHTLLSELRYLQRQGIVGRCLITVSYAKEQASSEVELQSRVPSAKWGVNLSDRLATACVMSVPLRLPTPSTVHGDDDDEPEVLLGRAKLVVLHDGQGDEVRWSLIERAEFVLLHDGLCV